MPILQRCPIAARRAIFALQIRSLVQSAIILFFCIKCPFSAIEENIAILLVHLMFNSSFYLFQNKNYFLRYNNNNGISGANWCDSLKTFFPAAYMYRANFTGRIVCTTLTLIWFRGEYCVYSYIYERVRWSSLPLWTLGALATMRLLTVYSAKWSFTIFTTDLWALCGHLDHSQAHTRHSPKLFFSLFFFLTARKFLIFYLLLYSILALQREERGFHCYRHLKSFFSFPLVLNLKWWKEKIIVIAKTIWLYKYKALFYLMVTNMWKTEDILYIIILFCAAPGPLYISIHMQSAV